ncbi:MAG: NnrS family protein, partial [Rubrivivax sp.]|nr:NnrS family protein [Rubrivivax sp.]
MTTSIPPLQATPPVTLPSPQGWPLLRLGFRPFYLCAAAYGMLAVPLWIALLLGQVSLNLTVSPLLWHAHEMLFGFAVAVIVGFLLTAGKAWTGLATPRGAVLGALAGLWLAARLAAVFAPYAVYAALDLLLLPLVAAILIAV